MRYYRIQDEVATELKINKWLYLMDLLILLGLLSLRMFTISYVHSKLQWPFTFFLVFVGISLIIRPTSNPQKRMFEAIYYAIIRRRDTFTAIDYSQPDLQITIETVTGSELENEQKRAQKVKHSLT